MLELQFGLLPEGSDESRASLHGAQAIARSALQVVEVHGAAVGEFVVLQMTPDVFGGIQFGRVGGQLLDLNGTIQGLQVLAHKRRAMRSQSIPDDQQRLADLLAEGVKELDDLWPLDGAGKESEVEAAEGDSGNHRQLAPVEVILQDRSVALGCPGPHSGWPLAQSGLVDEDDDPPLFRGVFFRAGQRVCFQRLMAGSSRSSARPEGRWQEKPRETRMRHTWLSLYERVKRRLINSPTRGNVHRSVAKPSASAPAVRARINSRRCASSSPEGRPRVRLLSPSKPPACSCAFHCDTVVRVTLTRRATSACATPRCRSRPARRRRRCNSFASRSDLLMSRLSNITYHVGQRTAIQVASHLCKSQ